MFDQMMWLLMVMVVAGRDGDQVLFFQIVTFRRLDFNRAFFQGS